MVFNPQPWLVQLADLFLIQLSNWRWTWRGMLVIGTLAPLLSILALGTLSGPDDPQTAAYILTGNVVLALMFENMNRVSSNFAFMQAMGTLYFFAALPIRRANLILATVLAFFVLSLPAVLLTIGVGALVLDIRLEVHPLVLVAAPLAAVPLAGIGALIGSKARSPEEAGSLTTLITFILLGLGPVIIPPERLPGWLVRLGALSPATYAASALRQTLIGPVTGRLALDLGVLLTFSGLVYWIVGRALNWRLTS